MGSVRQRWGEVTLAAGEAARVLDRPLGRMVERAWVGGQAPRFEQELAGQRQALQRAWAGLLEEIADEEQRSKRLLDFQPRLSVPSMTSTAELGGGSCYPPGAFTGVDVEGFEALARELLAAGPALYSAVQAMPAEPASGSVFGVEAESGPWSPCRPVSRPQARVILEIGEWAREQGRQIGERLEMIRRGESAAVTGLTAPNGLTGPMVPAAMAGTVLFAPSPPDATQTALEALTRGDTTAAAVLLGAQRAGYDSSLASQIAVAWKAVAPDQQQALLTADPASLGNLDGIPATWRDQANRAVLDAETARLTAEVARLTAERDQTFTRHFQLAANAGGSVSAPASFMAADTELSRLKNILTGIGAIQNRLDSTTAAPVFLLGFDTARHGHAIVSFGDPDTATDTLTYVPGLTTTLGGAYGDTQRALDAYVEAKRLIERDPLIKDQAKGHSLASVYWLGYDPPQLDGTLLKPSRTVLGTGPADQGAPRLASYTSGLRATHDPSIPSHVTVLGHSYGSLTTGTASTLAKGALADDLVFVGSPGVGVDHATGLGLSGDHVFAGAAENDPVTLLPDRKLIPLIQPNAVTNYLEITDDGAFGTDPSRQGFGGTAFHVAPSPVEQAHSNYWETDNSHGGSDESLNNISLIAIGRPDLITPDQ